MKYAITEKNIKDTPLIEVVVTFDDVIPTRYLNAFRRVQINNDIVTKYVGADEEDLITSDPYIIPNDFVNNLSSIPVDQEIPRNIKFSLKVSSLDSKVPVKIYSRDIKGLCPKYAPEFFPIGYLMPGHVVEIPELTVRFSRQNARNRQACQYFAGHNHLEDDKSQLRFTSLGTRSPKDILKESANHIMTILSGLKEQIKRIVPDPLFNGFVRAVWVLEGEDSTSIELINWAVQELYGLNVDIKVMDNDADGLSEITLSVKESLKYDQVLETSINHVLKFYSEFLESL